MRHMLGTPGKLGTHARNRHFFNVPPSFDVCVCDNENTTIMHKDLVHYLDYSYILCFNQII